MKFKVGQKVSFLNEQRNGIVTKIINAQMVNVEIEDGFDIPVMVNELVASEPMFENFSEPVYEASHTSSYQQPTTSQQAQEEEAEEIPRKSPINMQAKNELESGYYIAYACEEDDINSPYFYVYFINNSPFDAIFTYALKSEGQFIDKDYEKVASYTKVILDVIDRSQLEDWASVSFQLLQFNENGPSVKRPIITETHIPPVKLFRGQGFKQYQIIPHIAIVRSITPSKETIKESHDNPSLEKAFEEKGYRTIKKAKGPKIVGHINDTKATVVNKEAFPKEHIVANGIAEVDLHIDELTDTIEGMTNDKMFRIQIEYFQKMLESAITNHLKRIIFIHGIGNGKLKIAIRETLQKDYPKLEIFDASLAKYGKGATEIKIPVNQ